MIKKSKIKPKKWMYRKKLKPKKSPLAPDLLFNCQLVLFPSVFRTQSQIYEFSPFFYFVYYAYLHELVVRGFASGL